MRVLIPLPVRKTVNLCAPAMTWGMLGGDLHWAETNAGKVEPRARTEEKSQELSSNSQGMTRSAGRAKPKHVETG